MTDKQSQTSSQPSSSGADVERKPDHASQPVPDPTEIIETGAPVRQSQPGPSQASSRSSADKIVITVAPFTGGPFSVTLNKCDSVEDLKKIVAKKLKVLKERICLLYRERYQFRYFLWRMCFTRPQLQTLMPGSGSSSMLTSLSACIDTENRMSSRHTIILKDIKAQLTWRNKVLITAIGSSDF